jgi:hypothetical protein
MTNACFNEKPHQQRHDNRRHHSDEAGVDDAVLPPRSIFATSFAEATADQESYDVTRRRAASIFAKGSAYDYYGATLHGSGIRNYRRLRFRALTRL